MFSNGVVILAGLAMALIWIYDAQLTRLIQLYVVGVFTAFTLSQTGMVRRWFRVKGPGWKRSAIINGVGAFTTGVVLVIVTATKFQKGAKVVVIAIPIIVIIFLLIHRHYRKVRAVLARRLMAPDTPAEGAMLLLVHDLGPATKDAIAYLRAVRPERLSALFVGPEEDFPVARDSWSLNAPRLGPLEMLPRGDDHLVRAVRGYIRTVARKPEDFVTVVIPELLTRRTVAQFLVHRETFLLKTALLFEPGVVVTDVPLVPGEPRRGPDNRPLEPARSVVLIPVSAVHDRHRPRGGLCEVAAPHDDRGHLSGDRSGGDARRDRGLVRTGRSMSRCCWSKRRSAISEPRCSRRCTSTPNAATRW